MSGILPHLSTGDNFAIGRTDGWVVERKFRAVATAPSTVPFTILLLDRQYLAASDSTFVRHVRQVHHREAASKLSQVKISFNPARESLNIHWIRVWRAGEAIELAPSAENFRLEENVETKRQNAGFEIEDLRPADAIDVAYTLTSSQEIRTPSSAHSIRQRVPVLDWHLSMIAPEAQPITADCTLAEIETETQSLDDGSQLLSLARHRPPSGDPEDTRHPSLVSSEPASTSLRLRELE